MNTQHILYYLTSKVFAAVLNLLAVAVFARLSGPSGYGEYLVAFAWAYNVYGFSIQWLRFSFFARYRTEDASDQIATFAYSLLVLAAIIAALGALIGITHLAAFRTVASVIALVVSLAVYFFATRRNLLAGVLSSAATMYLLLLLAAKTAS